MEEIVVKKCRLCYQNIGQHEINTELAQQIQTIIEIKVNDEINEHLPRKICAKCKTIIEDILTYQQEIKKIDANLRATVENNQKLASRIKSQNVVVLYQCSTCSKGFSSEAAAEKHFDEEHGPQYQCNHCDHIFENEAIFDVHTCEDYMDAEGEPEEPPDVKEEIIQLKIGRARKRVENGEAKRIECKDCYRTYSNSSSFNKHNCIKEKDAISEELLKEMSKTFIKFELTEELEPNEEEGVLKCPLCSRVYKSMHFFTRHSCPNKENCLVKEPNLDQENETGVSDLKIEPLDETEEDSMLNTHQNDASSIDATDLTQGVVILVTECQNCLKMYKTQKNLDKHFLACEANADENSKARKTVQLTVIQCTVCQGKFKNRRNFDRHLNSCKPKEGIKIEVPDKEPVEEALPLIEDGPKMLYITVMECKKCTKMYKKLFNFQRHSCCKELASDSAHLELEDADSQMDDLPDNQDNLGQMSEFVEILVLECRVCLNIYKDQETFDVHVCKNKNWNRKKKPADPFFGETEEEAEKRRIKYKKPAVSREKHHGRYYCQYEGCTKSFLLRAGVKVHELRHNRTNRQFLCCNCGKSFMDKNALAMHEKSHGLTKDFICEVCSTGFKLASALKIHIRRAHEGFRYYCAKCPKAFRSVDTLHRHELSHVGIKPFICSACPKAFYTRKELEKHVRYHEGDKRYKCQMCFKSFFESYHLTMHMRMHTGERPFICELPQCGKRYIARQKLKRHQQKFHGMIFKPQSRW